MSCMFDRNESRFELRRREIDPVPNILKNFSEADFIRAFDRIPINGFCFAKEGCEHRADPRLLNWDSCFICGG